VDEAEMPEFQSDSGFKEILGVPEMDIEKLSEE